LLIVLVSGALSVVLVSRAFSVVLVGRAFSVVLNFSVRSVVLVRGALFNTSDWNLNFDKVEEVISVVSIER
jgi:hypothetical protein